MEVYSKVTIKKEEFTRMLSLYLKSQGLTDVAKNVNVLFRNGTQKEVEPNFYDRVEINWKESK